MINSERQAKGDFFITELTWLFGSEELHPPRMSGKI